MSRELNIFSDPSVTQSAGLPEGSRLTIPKRKPIPSSQAYERIPQVRPDHGGHEEHEKIFPQGARKSKVLKTLSILCDAVITILPVAFIVLAIFAWSEDNKNAQTARGETIIRAARIAPTVFPILFAAVVGRFLKAYALWRAERGPKIGLLELLLGGQNLTGAVQRVVVLRQLSLASLLLLLLWGLSPLGGQSSLRVLDIKMVELPGHQTVYYFRTSGNTNTYLAGAAGAGMNSVWINPVYQACLLAPNQVLNSATDQWNNVKIPMLETLQGCDLDDPTNKWCSVNSSQPWTYSSLTGIMIAGLPNAGTSNFTLESSYLTLAPLNERRWNISSTTPSPYKPVEAWLGPTGTRNDLTLGLNSAGFYINSNTNHTDVTTSVLYVASLQLPPQQQVVAAFNFSLATTYVESNVICKGQSCYIARMRRSTANKKPSYLCGVISNLSILVNFFIAFAAATGDGGDGAISPTALYVGGSDTPFDPELQVNGVTNTNLNAHGVSLRLATLMNTYWQSSLTVTYVATGATGANVNLTALWTGLDYPVTNTTAATTSSVTLYAAAHVWVGLTIAISSILLFCGVSGMFFTYAASAPNILGFVSTMTIDNPYVRHATGDGMLDGLERARLLKDVRVSIADVKAGEREGHIALTDSFGENPLKKAQFPKNRTYV